MAGSQPGQFKTTGERSDHMMICSKLVQALDSVFGISLETMIFLQSLKVHLTQKPRFLL